MRKQHFFRKEIKILSQGIMKGVLSLSVVSLLFFASCSNESLDQTELPKGDSQISRDGVPTATSKGSFDHGYFVAHYVSGGSASITFPNANQWPGNFALSWNRVNDVVSGKGWLPGSARTVNYNVGTLSGSYNLVGAYGWTTNPLIEFYVVELGSNIAGSYINTISSDGHNYNVYKHLQVNQPSVESLHSTFWQYLDNWGGSSTGSNHAINLGNHVNNWRARGGQGFGNFYYLVFGCEAWGGRSGYINATVW
jgi:endo-1,4-beta-xylanase